MRLRDREPIYTCWGGAAIQRCVDRKKGMSRNWDLSRLREIAPDGSRDQMLAVWFPTFDVSGKMHKKISERRLSPEDIAPAPRANAPHDTRGRADIAA